MPSPEGQTRSTSPTRSEDLLDAPLFGSMSGRRFRINAIAFVAGGLLIGGGLLAVLVVGGPARSGNTRGLSLAAPAVVISQGEPAGRLLPGASLKTYN